jgi:hypothetical protein
VTPQEAAAKAAATLEDAGKLGSSPEHRTTCVAVADGWMRLAVALATHPDLQSASKQSERKGAKA